jgi:hypothetical protein
MRKLDDICLDKLRLTKEFHRATQTYSTAVNTLYAQIGTLPKSEYEK